ncbi:MAG: ATP-binding protein [Sphaerochaetaceae bacterium]
MSESFKEMMARIAAENLKSIQQQELEEFGYVLTPEERLKHNQELKAKEEAELDAAEKAAQEKQQQAWLKGKMDSVPTRYKDATLDSYENDALKKSKAWDLLLDGSSAIIYGDYGCGKTHIGRGLCKYQWLKHVDAVFVTAGQIFQEMKQQFNGGNPESVIRKYQMIPYLVIDEVDKSYGTQLEYVTLFDIVNGRYDWCLTTVILINAKNAEDLPELVGGANFDRLGNAGVVIHLTQKSWRGNERKIIREEVF